MNDTATAGCPIAGQLCTCCAQPTYMRLKKVALCAPCGINLIQARSRELAKSQGAAALRFPVEDMKCGKRGHRPLKSKTK